MIDPSTNAAYDSDIVAWAREQAALLRAGNFSALDIEHIADEVEDVGRSEKRELGRRVAVLLTHLLKWRHQGALRSRSWERTIREQRRAIRLHVAAVPSLEATLVDDSWLASVWSDAVSKATEETGLADFPEVCPWSQDEILDPEFLPG